MKRLFSLTFNKNHVYTWLWEISVRPFFKEIIYENPRGNTYFPHVIKCFLKWLEGLYEHPNDCINHPQWFCIMWDMFGTYSEPFDHWKLFFEITFSKTSAWKWTKIRFLAYCDYKGNYYLFKLRNEEFRCLRSEYDNYNLITLQSFDTDDIEGCLIKWK